MEFQTKSSKLGSFLPESKKSATGREKNNPLFDQPEEPTLKERANILVIDDDPENRELLCRHLTRQGHSVKSVENGLAAFELLDSDIFDLILLDIRMPEMDGFEVLKRLKASETLHEVPVIVVSALYETESVIKGIHMGAEDYFLKPFTPVLLQARIDTCLEKRRLRLLNQALELRNIKEDTKMVAASPAMQRVLETVKAVSRIPVNVLILGENGTGKELIARMIHMESKQKNQPLVAVNCAAIPENLAESEFFGYQKGAFTGATVSRGGRFEEADGGTLMLDEVADMPWEIQPKFLRAIQEGEGRRLGSSKTVSYNFRLISATNKDIAKEISEGRFREDLFYRIFSVEIHIPPLRERKEDIAPLTRLFLNKVGQHFSKAVPSIAPEVLDLFEEYPWPGNVRQLQHEVERLVALTLEGGTATLAQCSHDLQSWNIDGLKTFRTYSENQTLPEKIRELEVFCIKQVLSEVGGKKAVAAQRLGISRQGLDKKMKRYGVQLPVK